MYFRVIIRVPTIDWQVAILNCILHPVNQLPFGRVQPYLHCVSHNINRLNKVLYVNFITVIKITRHTFATRVLFWSYNHSNFILFFTRLNLSFKMVLIVHSPLNYNTYLSIGIYWCYKLMSFYSWSILVIVYRFTS